MRNSRKHLALALTTLALVAAGCGDDDEEEPQGLADTPSGATGASGASGDSGPAGLLPEEYAADADAICLDASQQLEALTNKLEDPSELEVEAFVAEEVVPNIQGQLDDLSDLDPPDTGVDEWEAFLADAQNALDELEADPGGEGDDFFEGISDQAEELGLSECGTG